MREDVRAWTRRVVRAFLLACGTCAPPRATREPTVGWIEPVRVTVHQGSDDLLSAGLGLDGLRAAPPAFADPVAPSPAELRRRAIHVNWNGIADLAPLGAYGRVYGGVPAVPGREFSAFARVPGARSPHRVLLQVPDAFDTRARCLLVAASSGSRGVYGSIALAAAWALPRGCAVVHTDKGAGTGYFDASSATGVTLDGTRAARGEAMLEFEPVDGAGDAIAVKHAHSGDHPEADWGRHVLQAAQFGLAMLDRAFPSEAPFTARNTRVIAAGLSNGGGAVLQAAGLDADGLLSAVVALAPNVHVEGHGRPLYDYATEAALLLPCALLDARFDAVPFARHRGQPPAAWLARCAHLHAQGLLAGADVGAWSADALARLDAAGWSMPALESAASSTAFDLWRTLSAAYASAYLRRGAGTMAHGLRYATVDGAPANAATRAAWWSDASGLPPGAGVVLLGGRDDAPEADGVGAIGLREAWSGGHADARVLRAAVARTRAGVPRPGLPVLVAHGEADGLLPIAFGANAYVSALQAAGRACACWRIPHAQHFDAFLSLGAFGARHVPLLPYGYAALDAVAAHLDGAPMPASRRFATRPRGAGVLTPAMLGLER